MSLAEIRLDDKYRVATGQLYLTGTQAPMSSTLEIIHKYHIISAQISAWEKPF